MSLETQSISGVISSHWQIHFSHILNVFCSSPFTNFIHNIKADENNINVLIVVTVFMFDDNAHKITDTETNREHKAKLYLIVALISGLLFT